MDTIIAFRLPNGRVEIISDEGHPKVWPDIEDAISFGETHFAAPNLLKDCPWQPIELDEL